MLGRLIYNNMIMLTIVCVIFISVLTIGGIKRVRANESNTYDKSFVTIVVEEGDTLSSIAATYAISEAEYKDYINEVISINNLKNDTIHTGCYLLVPVYDVR